MAASNDLKTFGSIKRFFQEKMRLKNRPRVFIFSALLLFPVALLLGLNLAISLLLFSLVVYLENFISATSRPHYNILHLAFIFVVVFCASYLILHSQLSKFYLPFPVLAMLSVILFGEPFVSLLLVIAVSLGVAHVAGNDFQVSVLFLLSGIFSILFLRGVRRRNTIVRAGFMIGLLQALTLFFLEGFRAYDHRNYLVLFGSGIAYSIIVVGVLPIFEYLFKTVTNISLLELADFNHPLLQRMILEAPGTYHHSLVVGNLSEAASSMVGANALLARIGSYYHDIGKLEKPDYFSENQVIDASKHDELSPTMSKLVIMNHIKEGIELAKKYRLNPYIIDFIQQHHGTSLVFYFYRRALENSGHQEEVKEEGFRYPGPKPATKEAAIVMLADSVEAATRAIKDPTPAKVEEVVRKIINNKFIDGQLDECDLTLKDLESISKCFSRILGAIYHSRITYPEKIEGSESGQH